MTEKAPNISAIPSDTGSETGDPRDHYAELDALRGLAIFGVFMTHLSGYWFQATRLQLELPLLQLDFLELLRYGYLGVSLFFLLSGYLLTWTEEKRQRRGTYSPLSYARRRAFRLIPAYYFAIAVIILVRPNDPSLVSVGWHLSFLHGFLPAYPGRLDPVFWSLTPEIAFYLALPLLVLWLRSLPARLVLLGALITLSLAARIYMGTGPGFAPLGESFEGNRLYFYPTTLLYLFIVGMLLRKAVERIGQLRSPVRWRRPASLACSVAPLALLVFPFFLPQNRFLQSPLAMVAELLVIALFAAVLLGSPLLKPLTSWRTLAFFGKISYSVFLLHATVIFLLFRYVLWELRPWLMGLEGPIVWGSFALFAFSALAITILVSYLSYRFVESPFLRRKPE